MPSEKPKALSDWQPQGGPLVPLAAQLNMAKERPSTEPAPPPPRSSVVPMVAAAAVAAAATAGAMWLLFPAVVVDPIVIVSGPTQAAPTPAGDVPSAAPAKPAALPAALPSAPSAVPAPAVAAAGDAPRAPVPGAKPSVAGKKGLTVEDAFAKVALAPAEAAAAPAPATEPAAASPAPAPPPHDELTSAEVSEVLRAHRASTEACAEAQRAATPEANGVLTLRYTVSAEGSVTAVTALGELQDSDFAKCLVKELGTWTFPKHASAHAPLDATFKF